MDNPQGATPAETLDDDNGDATYLLPRLAAYIDPGQDVGHREDGVDDGDVDAENAREAYVVESETLANSSPSFEMAVGQSATPYDAVESQQGGSDDEPVFMLQSGDDDIDNDGQEEADGGDNNVEEDDGDVAENLAGLFQHTRVKELLRFEGNSSVISKTAAQTASEAVVLILQDVTKAAATEASRRNRKTIMYDDVARVVQLYDRFAFLSDIIPPSAATSAMSSSVHVGSGVRQQQRQTQLLKKKQSMGTMQKEAATELGSSRGAGGPSKGSGVKERRGSTKQRNSAAAAAAAEAEGVPLGGHFLAPGSGMRQATLRF